MLAGITANPEIKNGPEYLGAYTKNQAEGAIPNGTRIVKCFSPPSDSRPVGSTGTVIGSLDVPEDVPGVPFSNPGGYFYFVEWDEMRGVAVGCTGVKIKELES